MFSLILLLVFGTGIALLAMQNATPVTLSLFTYTFPNLPLFYIMIGSMLTGIIFAYVIYLTNSIYTSFIIRGKDKKIRQERKELTELTKKLHQLEIENAKLKNETGTESIDEKSL